MGTRAPKVFCSYGSPDREVVAGLATWLREQGVDAWLDVWDLVPGESFIAGIEAGLAGAERVLVFLSRRSEEQLWRKAEVEAAIDRMVRDGIPVVPVMIDADAHVPMLLRSRSQIRQLDRPEDRDALLESIHGRSSKPVLGPPPELWSEQARVVLEERFAAAWRESSLGAVPIRDAARGISPAHPTWKSPLGSIPSLPPNEPVPSGNQETTPGCHTRGQEARSGHRCARAPSRDPAR